MRQEIKPPLYHRIRSALQNYISENNLRAGHRLPSEHQLMKQYGISRITIRRALAELENDGLVVRRHGQGTFVASNRIKGQLAHLSSFSEDMLERGFKTFAKVLELKIIEPDRETMINLNLPENELVVSLKRIRYANHDPIAFEACYLPASRFSGLLGEDFTRQSLKQLLHDHFAVNFSYVKQYVTTCISSRSMMEHFGLEYPAALLLMRRIVYDANNLPVQYTLSYYRGDLYEYEVNLQM